MTRKKHMKHTWLCMLALMLVLCMIPAHVLAAGVDGSKSASPTTLNKDHNETQVSLTLPSAESKHVYDVVFVMDSSTSTANNDIDFSDYVNDLLDAVTEKNATIKVGVVKCRGRAFDTIDLASDSAYSGLVEYADDTKDAITNGVNFTEAQLKALSSGTNMHGGLDMANGMLNDDKDVPNENKFVILLLDGKTYIWNNDADEPTTYYTQYMAKGTVYPTPAVGQQTGAYTKSAYKHKDAYYYTDMTNPDLCFYFADYADIYNSTNPELSDTATVYDHYCAYADKQGSSASGTAVTHDTTNGSGFTYALQKKYYEFIPGSGWEDLHWLEAAPYEVIENGDGTYSYDLDTPNPDFYQVHPDSLQKGTYLTGHLWTDMGEKYHTAAVVYSGWKGGSGLEVAKSFCDWIKTEEASEYAAEITEADQVEAVFDSIKEEIIYMVAKGVVTDTIPENFTLVDNGTNTFTLTVNGEAVAATADGENAWNFGEANEEGVYPYRIEFDESSNSYRWEINVPIEVSNPVTLTYTLAIDKESEAGTYPTNTSAVLDYKTSSGDTGTYEFPIPEVTFEVTEEKPDNPETGDRGKAMILGMLVVLSLAGIVTASVVIRKEDHAA